MCQYKTDSNDTNRALDLSVLSAHNFRLFFFCESYFIQNLQWIFFILCFVFWILCNSNQKISNFTGLTIAHNKLRVTLEPNKDFLTKRDS